MKNIYKNYIVFFALIILGISCRKELPPPSPNTNKDKMDDLIVSPDFNYETAKDIDVWITIPDSVAIRTVFIMSINEMTIYYKGLPDTNTNVFETTISLPASLKAVCLKYGNGHILKSAKVAIINDLIIYNLQKLSYKGGGPPPPVPDDVDTDGDGVPDISDDYPEDPYKAYNNYTPAAEYGSLAYEDLWPSKGDYEYNDLVLNYRFMVVTNSSDEVVEIECVSIVMAIGASFHNGFGFELEDISPDLIISATGYDLPENTFINLNANGTETSQENATFIVFQDAYDILQYPGSGIGINTSPAAPYVEPDTVTMTIIFMEDGEPAPGELPINPATLNIAGFNPFIFVNENRGKEIHLPDYPPTDLVDPSYFDTYDDDSGNGKWYKTVNNLPWAINIVGGFDYPIEKADILLGYLKFADWAESSGAIYTDWYEDVPGYRNPTYIYPIP